MASNMETNPASFSIKNYTVPSMVAYFYGRILREDAEKIIRERSKSIENKNGLFLLRESMQEIGNYALSIYNNSNIVHYKIKRQDDFQLSIINGNRQGLPFIGPIELINYYKNNDSENFIIKPQIACDRPMGIQPIYYLFVSNSDLHNQVNEEIEKSLQDIKNIPHLYKQELVESRTRLRYQHEKNLMKNMEKMKQLAPAWFKENFSGLKGISK